ncbi:hypothetical protein D3C80_1511780 [compost metagenome]
MGVDPQSLAQQQAKRGLVGQFQCVLDKPAKQRQAWLVAQVIQLPWFDTALEQPVGRVCAHHPQLFGNLSQVVHGEQEVGHGGSRFS